MPNKKQIKSAPNGLNLFSDDAFRSDITKKPGAPTQEILQKLLIKIRNI